MTRVTIRTACRPCPTAEAAIPRQELLSGLLFRLLMFAENAYLTRRVALASAQKPTPFFTSSAVFEENLSSTWNYCTTSKRGCQWTETATVVITWQQFQKLGPTPDSGCSSCY
jgi:hypothetical protein